MALPRVPGTFRALGSLGVAIAGIAAYFFSQKEPSSPAYLNKTISSVATLQNFKNSSLGKYNHAASSTTFASTVTDPALIPTHASIYGDEGIRTITIWLDPADKVLLIPQTINVRGSDAEEMCFFSPNAKHSQPQDPWYGQVISRLIGNLRLVCMVKRVVEMMMLIPTIIWFVKALRQSNDWLIRHNYLSGRSKNVDASTSTDGLLSDAPSGRKGGKNSQAANDKESKGSWFQSDEAHNVDLIVREVMLRLDGTHQVGQYKLSTELQQLENERQALEIERISLAEEDQRLENQRLSLANDRRKVQIERDEQLAEHSQLREHNSILTGVVEAIRTWSQQSEEDSVHTTQFRELSNMLARVLDLTTTDHGEDGTFGARKDGRRQRVSRFGALVIDNDKEPAPRPSNASTIEPATAPYPSRQLKSPHKARRSEHPSNMVSSKTPPMDENTEDNLYYISPGVVERNSQLSKQIQHDTFNPRNSDRAPPSLRPRSFSHVIDKKETTQAVVAQGKARRERNRLETSRARFQKTLSQRQSRTETKEEVIMHGEATQSTERSTASNQSGEQQNGAEKAQNPELGQNREMKHKNRPQLDIFGGMRGFKLEQIQQEHEGKGSEKPGQQDEKRGSGYETPVKHENHREQELVHRVIDVEKNPVVEQFPHHEGKLDEQVKSQQSHHTPESDDLRVAQYEAREAEQAKFKNEAAQRRLAFIHEREARRERALQEYKRGREARRNEVEEKKRIAKAKQEQEQAAVRQLRNDQAKKDEMKPPMDADELKRQQEHEQVQAHLVETHRKEIAEDIEHDETLAVTTQYSRNGGEFNLTNEASDGTILNVSIEPNASSHIGLTAGNYVGLFSKPNIATTDQHHDDTGSGSPIFPAIQVPFQPPTKEEFQQNTFDHRSTSSMQYEWIPATDTELDIELSMNDRNILDLTPKSLPPSPRISQQVTTIFQGTESGFTEPQPPAKFLEIYRNGLQLGHDSSPTRPQQIFEPFNAGDEASLNIDITGATETLGLADNTGQIRSSRNGAHSTLSFDDMDVDEPFQINQSEDISLETDTGSQDQGDDLIKSDVGAGEGSVDWVREHLITLEDELRTRRQVDSVSSDSDQESYHPSDPGDFPADGQSLDEDDLHIARILQQALDRADQEEESMKTTPVKGINTSNDRREPGRFDEKPQQATQEQMTVRNLAKLKTGIKFGIGVSSPSTAQPSSIRHAENNSADTTFRTSRPPEPDVAEPSVPPLDYDEPVFSLLPKIADSYNPYEHGELYSTNKPPSANAENEYEDPDSVEAQIRKMSELGIDPGQAIIEQEARDREDSRAKKEAKTWELEAQEKEYRAQIEDKEQDTTDEEREAIAKEEEEKRIRAERIRKKRAQMWSDTNKLKF